MAERDQSGRKGAAGKNAAGKSTGRRTTGRKTAGSSAAGRRRQPGLRLVKREHTLLYGLRLLPDEVLAEQSHPRVEVPRPDGGTETLTLHTITGDREEIRRKLLESVDAFFEIFGERLP